MFNAFSKSVMGQSHVKKNIVCQDSSAHKVTDDYAIAVVADGHGSKKHFRSNIGSKCAVEATLEVLARFMETEGFFETFPERRSSVIKNIEKQVIACWNEKVNAHHDANPVTVVEKKPFTHDEFAEIPVESYYGTTLICGVMCKDFTFGFQLGDGSLVTVLEDGTTSSMSNANAASMFAEFYSVEPKVAALFASTDGLYTTFGGEQAFFDYHTLIASQLIDPEKVRASVENNIAKRTHYGTEDDISFACAVNGDLLAECRPALINKVAENKRAAAEKKVKQ